MNKLAPAVLSLALLSACQTPSDTLHMTYEPIVDKKGVKMEKYYVDLRECRDYAQTVHDETVTQGIVMAVIGAGIGAAIGNQYDMTSQGAQYGAVLGATSGTIDGQVNYRAMTMHVIDQCMTGRGYKVLGRK